MLFDVAAWVVIILVAWTVGRGVLALLRVDDLRAGDAFAIAAWIGVVILTLSLLAVSIAAPLTPTTAAIVALALASLGAVVTTVAAPVRATVRRAITDLPVVDWRLVALGACALVIGASALTSDPVTLYDSLVYHVGIMRWLREHGTVPGIALVHNRLGHVSAWFTLAAPFDHGPAANRMATIPLGVALVLVALQTSVAAARVVARRGWVADWFFIAVSVGLFWAVVVRDAATPSPDVATNVLIASTAWSVLVISQGAPGGLHRGLRTGHALVPLMLALGAAAMKLFALPAAIVAAGFFIVTTRTPGSAWSLVKAALVAGAIAFIGLAPFLAANMAASGCPVYPSPLGCMRLPWSVGSAAAADYAEYIRDVARWDRRGNVPPNDPTGWIVPWIAAHPVVTLLAVLSPVIATVLLRHARRDQMRQTDQPTLTGARTVVALGLVGIAFAAWQAPAPRFLYMVVLLIPSLAGAYWMHAALGSRGTITRTAGGFDRFSLGFAGAATIIGLTYGIASQKLNVLSFLEHGAPLVHMRSADLMLPAAPQAQPRLFRWRVNDVDVLTPVPRPIVDTLGYQSVIAHNAEFEKCSTAPLPCTPYLPGRDIRLRRPERGLEGGFVRIAGLDFASSVATCLGELSMTTSAHPESLRDPPPGPDASRCQVPDGR